MQDLAFDIGDMDGPLGQRVYLALRDRILNLTLEPGAVLRKGALCDQMGVSRSPIAEALGRLSSDGLVDIIPQSATRVARFSTAGLLEENFLREAVEVAAVARLTATRTDEQLVRLNRNIRLQQLLLEDGDTQGFFQADLEFHHIILGFTGFPNVTRVAEEMTLQLRRARQLMLPEPGRPAQVLAEHATIVQAIKDKDTESACSAMADHVRQLISRIEPLERDHPEYFRPS